MAERPELAPLVLETLEYCIEELALLRREARRRHYWVEYWRETTSRWPQPLAEDDRWHLIE